MPPTDPSDEGRALLERPGAIYFAFDALTSQNVSQREPSLDCSHVLAGIEMCSPVDDLCKRSTTTQQPHQEQHDRNDQQHMDE